MREGERVPASRDQDPAGGVRPLNESAASFCKHLLSSRTTLYVTPDAAMTMTMADAIDARETALMTLDTGQQLCNDLDTGQHLGDDDTALFSTHDLVPFLDVALAVTHQEIHRIDALADGEKELVMSTLKAFQLRIAVQSAAGKLVRDLDGMVLRATLLYEDGQAVKELSATQEPPLLNGQALVENGIASFRMRITVLSSLCHARRFRVRIHAEHAPELATVTSAVKTITKLRRGSREAREALREAREARGQLSLPSSAPRSPLSDSAAPLSCGKRSLGLEGDAVSDDELKEASWKEAKCRGVDKCHGFDAALDEETSCDTGRSLEEMWDEIHVNGRKLIELQRQQAALFQQLRTVQDELSEGLDEA